MNFSVKILGSNSAFPTSNRFSTAQVLNVHERFFLIDCAEGTQIQLRRYKIPFPHINHIFISHLHGDHFYGLFGVISTFNLLGRKNDLHIYAHPNLEHIIANMLQYTDFKTNFEVIYHKLQYKEPQLIYDDKKMTVHSLPLKHRVETCGFVFREKELPRNMKKDAIRDYGIPVHQIPLIKQGADFIDHEGRLIVNRLMTTPPPIPRSYAFCSDTHYTEKIIEHISGVDLLYHEATFAESEVLQAKKTGHSTAKQAATIAQKAQVGQLIIGHFSTRYKAHYETLLAEAREVFANTEQADDGKEFSVVVRTA